MRLLVVILLGFTMLLSCASPQKSFNKGNYEKAFTSSLKSLKKGDKDRKLKSILNKSFDKLYEEHMSEVDRLSSSSYIEDWEESYLHLSKLLAYYDEGERYLDSDLDVAMSTAREQALLLREDLSSGFYNLASEKMDSYDRTGDKSMAQDAHQFYLKALDYGYEDRDLRNEINTAYEAAIVTINVEASAPYDLSYNWEIDRRFDDLENESEGFVKVTYDGMSMNADCNMEIRFSNLRRNLNERSTIRNFSERIQDGYDTQVDTSGRTTRVPIYVTVTGQVDIITEEYNYEWEASVNNYGDSRYCNFNNRRFRETERLVVERYQISGDRRAIPNEYLNDRVDNIDEDRVAEDLMDEIYDDIRRYYFN